MQVLNQKSHALIDCGAMMAGATNREVADYMCPQLDLTLFQGVVYFDQDHEKWMAKDRRYYYISTWTVQYPCVISGVYIQQRQLG